MLAFNAAYGDSGIAVVPDNVVDDRAVETGDRDCRASELSDVFMRLILALLLPVFLPEQGVESSNTRDRKSV